METIHAIRGILSIFRQLGQLCTLCEPLDIHTHVIPIAINLATDKVADVRLLAIEVVSSIYIASLWSNF